MAPDTTGDLPRLFTLKEVADHTGFALRTLERDCRAGRVAHVHRGRDRRMTAEQVQALIQNHSTDARPDPSPDAETFARVARMAAQQAAKTSPRRR